MLEPMRVSLILVLLFLLLVPTSSWTSLAFRPTIQRRPISTTVPLPRWRPTTRRLLVRVSSSSFSNPNEQEEAGGDISKSIRNMSVRQLKEELTSLKISTHDAFEKETLVQRLLEARRNGQNHGAATGFNSSGKNDSKYENKNSQPKSNAKSDVIQVPLLLTGMDRRSIDSADGRGGITIEPTSQPYPTIAIHIPGHERELRLLLDTACSGFVLRPEVVTQYNLPSYQTPVTMTGAGGTVSATGLTQISQFRVGGHQFGPLPASVQDIGALPETLDGIIGLSFLQQFACVELHFQKGLVQFYRSHDNIPDIMNDESGEGLVCVAESEMRMLPKLGIYTTPVWLGEKGPVELLVDTGASCSLLSWKGVSDLGLDRNGRHIQPVSNPTGAMGSDNVAMALTHRLNASSKLNLGKQRLPGVALGGSRRLSIDIGRIPLLETLQRDGVGGILGIDALMRCAMVRIYCSGRNKKIELFDGLA